MGIRTSKGGGASHKTMHSSATLSTSSSVIHSGGVMVAHSQQAISLLNVQLSMELSTTLKNVVNFVWELLDLLLTCVATLGHAS